jgi:hypothetical protein
VKDTWWNHNTDKMVLLFLIIMLWTSTIFAAMHIFHHDFDSMAAVAFIAFMTGSVSTVLGGLMLIMNGRIQRADQQANTPQTNSTPPTPPEVPKG